jgi:toluene monooxygenase system protein B
LYINFQFDFCPLLMPVDTDNTMDEVAAAAAHHCLDRRVAEPTEAYELRVRVHGKNPLLPRGMKVSEAGFRPTETVDIVFANPGADDVIGFDYTQE